MYTGEQFSQASVGTLDAFTPRSFLHNALARHPHPVHSPLAHPVHAAHAARPVSVFHAHTTAAHAAHPARVAPLLTRPHKMGSVMQHHRTKSGSASGGMRPSAMLGDIHIGDADAWEYDPDFEYDPNEYGLGSWLSKAAKKVSHAVKNDIKTIVAVATPQGRAAAKITQKVAASRGVNLSEAQATQQAFGISARSYNAGRTATQVATAIGGAAALVGGGILLAPLFAGGTAAGAGAAGATAAGTGTAAAGTAAAGGLTTASVTAGIGTAGTLYGAFRKGMGPDTPPPAASSPSSDSRSLDQPVTDYFPTDSQGAPDAGRPLNQPYASQFPGSDTSADTTASADQSGEAPVKPVQAGSDMIMKAVLVGAAAYAALKLIGKGKKGKGRKRK